MINTTSNKEQVLHEVPSLWFLLYAVLACQNIFSFVIVADQSIMTAVVFTLLTVTQSILFFSKKSLSRNYLLHSLFLFNTLFFPLYFGTSNSATFLILTYYVFILLGSGLKIIPRILLVISTLIIITFLHSTGYYLDQTNYFSIPTTVYLGVCFFSIFLVIDSWSAHQETSRRNSSQFISFILKYFPELQSTEHQVIITPKFGAWKYDIVNETLTLDDVGAQLLFNKALSELEFSELEHYLSPTDKTKFLHFVKSSSIQKKINQLTITFKTDKGATDICFYGNQNTFASSTTNGLCSLAPQSTNTQQISALAHPWFEQSMVGVIQLEQNYTIKQANDIIAKYLLCEPSYLVGKSLFELIVKADHNIDNENYKAVLEGKINSYTVDKRLYDKAGTEKWFHLNFINQQTSGTPNFILLVQEHTTNSYPQLDNQVSNKLLKGVFQTMQSLVFRYNLTTRKSYLLEIDDGIFLEYNYHELNGINIFTEEFVSDEFLLGIGLKLGELQRQEATIIKDFQIKFISKSGKTVWVSFSCQLTDPNEILCILSDITTQKQTEQELYENNLLLNEAERASGMGSWEMDMTSEKLSWSDEIKKTYGIDLSDQPTFRESLSYFSFRSRSEFEDQIYETVKNIVPFDDEFEIIDQNGNQHIVRITGRPIIVDGRVVKISGLLQSIDAQKSAQTKLDSLKSQLVNAQRNANIGSWDYNYLTRNFQCSDEMKRILRLPVEHSLTKDEFESYYTAESRILIERATDNSIRQKLTYDREIEIFTSGGLKKWVRAIGSPNFSNNDLISFTGTFQDIDATKKTSIKVQEQTERYIAATEGSTDAFMILSSVLDEEEEIIDFQLLEFNTAAIKLIPEIISITKHASIKRYLPNALFKRLVMVFTMGRTYDNEVKVSANYINSSWVNLTVVRVTNGIAITIRDITDRKEASLRLKKQSERYIAATEGGFDAFFIIQPHYRGEFLLDDFEVIEANTVFAGLVGKSSDEDIKGKPMSKLLPKYKDMGLYKRFEDVLYYNDPIREEFLLNFEDIIGESRWVSLKVIKISDGIAVTFTDINDRKNAEIRLAETYENLENVKKALDESTLTSSFDIEGRFTQINSYFELITGFESFEIVGDHFTDFFEESEGNYDLAKMLVSIRDGRIWSGEVKGKTKAGQAIWLDTVIKPIVNEEGRIMEYLSLQKNITERKQIEAEREILISELTSNNKDLEQFTYITSHNLRAPIASMLGLINLYKKYGEDIELQKDIVDKIRISAETLDNTFRDLNQMLEIRRNLNEIKEDVNLEDIVKNVLISLDSQIKETSARITVSFNSINTIYTIKSYAESIVINLIGNAIKYKQPDKAPQIDLYTKETSEYVILYVKDNGLGIDLDRYGNHLFRLYSRFHLHKEGKGIGLHLVKNQADSMGGKVEVESKINEGTTFKVYFKR